MRCDGAHNSEHDVAVRVARFAPAVLVVALAACGDSTPTNPGGSSIASGGLAVPTADTSGKVLAEASGTPGSGLESQTASFTAVGQWEVRWAWDCSHDAAQQSGNYINIIPKVNGQSTGDPVNAVGSGGAGTKHYSAGGTFTISVYSTCPWHIVVSG